MKVASASAITIVLYTALLFVCLAFLGSIVWSIIYSVKTKNKNGIYAVLFSLLSIALAAFSWITNLGWIRFILTILLIPFVHALAFVTMNVCASKYVNCSKTMKVSVWLFYITYLCTYIFLPDSGDHGPMYMFFGLVRSNSVANIAYYVSMGAFMMHIATFIVQMVQISDYKKKMKLINVNELK